MGRFIQTDVECLKLKVKNAQRKLWKHMRFSLPFKGLLLLPMILWLMLFQFCKYIPESIRPEIDVHSLPAAESVLLFGYSLQTFPRSEMPEGMNTMESVMDVLAAFVYIIHFVVSWIFAAALYLYYRRKFCTQGLPIVQPWTFLLCFGFMNLFAVITQLSWPTAPPWYVDNFGERPANYSMEGSAAGLERADTLLRLKLFERLYGNSPLVFGSWPSLHGAWPIMITIFLPRIVVLKVLGVIYILWVWWAAMYLNHHFLVDLLGGLLFVILGYFLGLATLEVLKTVFKDKMFAGAMELIELEFEKLKSEEEGVELSVMRKDSDDEDK